MLATPRVAEALERASAIGRALAQPEREHLRGPGFSQGCAGVALLHAALARATGDEAAAGRADVWYAAAVAELSRTPAGPGLFRGVAGVAWACHAIERLLDRTPHAEDTEEADQALLALARAPARHNTYELTMGTVGLGVHALEHPDPGFAEALVAAVVDRLAEGAVVEPDGITWESDAAMMPKASPEMSLGHRNLGLAHGVPGVIALLARIVAGGGPARATELLEGAVAWMAARAAEATDGGVVRLACARTRAGDLVGQTRAAWCTGAPGVGIALLAAAQAAGRDDWRRLAVAALRSDGDGDPRAAGVVDPGICHGSAGLGLVYVRAHAATGEPAFAAAARRWTAVTLDGTRDSDDGFAGAWAMELDADGAPRRARIPGVLSGAAGIGLVLLTAADPSIRGWDAPLLTNVDGIANAARA